MAKIQNRRMYIGYLNVSKNILCELSDVFTETCHTCMYRTIYIWFSKHYEYLHVYMYHRNQNELIVFVSNYLLSPLYFLRLIVNDCCNIDNRCRMLRKGRISHLPRSLHIDLYICHQTLTYQHRGLRKYHRFS